MSYTQYQHKSKCYLKYLTLIIPARLYFINIFTFKKRINADTFSEMIFPTTILSNNQTLLTTGTMQQNCNKKYLKKSKQRNTSV